ncbi:MAG TPA: RNA polymerase sigma-70 factor [Parasegetibacter sp.]
MERIYINDDSELLQRFRSGDDDAFAQLYRKYNKKVFFYVRKFTNDLSEAEDISSECFIKLWNRKETFHTMESIAAFLYVAARNSCYDLLRHTKMKAEKQAELTELLYEPDEDYFRAEQIRLELLKLISKEVDKLPARMREIFLLSYSEGLKPAQIAERLQLNVQTVKNQRLNAVRLLKAALADHPLLATLLMILEFDGKFIV